MKRRTRMYGARDPRLTGGLIGAGAGAAIGGGIGYYNAKKKGGDATKGALYGAGLGALWGGALGVAGGQMYKMDRDIAAGNKALSAERDAREALEKAHDKKLKNLANSHAESSIHFGKEINKLKGESDKASKRMDHLFNQIPSQKAPATPLPEVPKFTSPLQGTADKGCY